MDLISEVASSTPRDVSPGSSPIYVSSGHVSDAHRADVLLRSVPLLLHLVPLFLRSASSARIRRRLLLSGAADLEESSSSTHFSTASRSPSCQLAALWNLLGCFMCFLAHYIIWSSHANLCCGFAFAPPAFARLGAGKAFLRITGDDWDTWRDVVSHFDISRSSFMCITVYGDACTCSA
ncbi:unnamed protein product [Microthlaspi erraticum]|uniref:Uncharacterized protein n=1 Tax=Microthlaspi erraticum TaxID=1685480 RepID=A0A6D2HSG8_9BRAS|nr:unnamed protein product [Microthlaspi erraticum]